MNFLFDNLIHVANVLYLLSYLVSDILWLRCLTVVAGLILLPYYLSLALWAPVIWIGLFTLINAYQIYLLLLARRPVQLSEKDQRLYQLAFRSLTPREFLKLISVGQWHEAEPNTLLFEEEKVPQEFVTLFEGTVDVKSGSESVASLGPGCFLGEISFLTKEASNVDVSTSETTQYFAWPMEALRTFLGKNSEIRAAWQLMIGADLATKLKGKTESQVQA